MKDPQLVVEYVHDIMTYLKKIEPKFRAKPTYMTEQQDINGVNTNQFPSMSGKKYDFLYIFSPSARMREILIDWLNEVHLKFKVLLPFLFP